MNRKALKGITLVLSCAPLTFILDSLVVTLSLSLPYLTAVCWKYLLSAAASSQPTIVSGFILLALAGGLSRAYPYVGELFDAYFRDKTSVRMQSRIHEKARRLSGNQFEDPALNDLIMMSGDTFFYGTVTGVALAFIYVIASVISLVLSVGLIVSSFPAAVASVFILFVFVHFVKIRLAEKRGAALSRLEILKRDEQVMREYFSTSAAQKDRQLRQLDETLYREWDTMISRRHSAVQEITGRYFAVNLFVDILSSSVFVLMLWMMLSGAQRAEMGSIGALLLLSSTIKQQVHVVTGSISGLAEVSSYIGKGVDFLELPEGAAGEHPSVRDNGVLLSRVSYRYPNSSKYALSDISLAIEEGKSYAIVGVNGSGKTTLFKVILGLLEPTEGEASVGFVGDSGSKRYSEVSIAPQEYNNYQFTVRDGIHIADTRSDFDAGRAETLCREFSLLDRIERMRDRFGSRLGKEFGGEDLSGGQWQALSLVRCFYRDSRYFVLDEPTASLDAYRETQTYDAILNRVSARTSVVITHRMGILKGIDHIFVLDRGRLIEQGPHSELMQRRGLYYRLYSSQLEQFEGEKERGTQMDSAVDIRLAESEKPGKGM